MSSGIARRRAKQSRLLVALVAVECLRDDTPLKSAADVARPFVDEPYKDELKMLCRLTNRSSDQLRKMFEELFPEAIELLHEHKLKPYWM